VLDHNDLVCLLLAVSDREDEKIPVWIFS